MEGVAAAMGMAKRTIYARYEDKSALFHAAVQQAIDAWVMPRDALVALDRSDLKNALLAVARLRIAHILSPTGHKLQRILSTESYRFPELFESAYVRGSLPQLEFVAGLLSEYHAAGRVTVERPMMAATVFMGMVVGGPTRGAAAGQRLKPAQVEDRVQFSVDLFLKGIDHR